jgi:hypothetical protein
VFNKALYNPHRPSLRVVSFWWIVLWRYMLLLAGVAVVNMTSYAQPAVPIEPGQVVRAAITDDSYEHRYQFAGEAGQVIVAQMRSVNRDLDNLLLRPVLILRGPSSRVIVDTSIRFDLDDTILVAELPADGDYILLATRELGAGGLHTGGFTLVYEVVSQLITGSSHTGQIDSDDPPQFFFFRPERPARISYQREGGNFGPQITVHTLDPAVGGREPLGSMRGEGMTRGALGNFDAGQTYLVEIGISPNHYVPKSVEARYTLSIHHD